MDEGDEVLDVASGKGVPLEYFVREFGVHGSGVDMDARLGEEAEARARESGLSPHLQLQTAPPYALPYRDEIFDVSVGELGLAAHCDPADAVRELVRVTKPGGHIVPSGRPRWTRPASASSPSTWGPAPSCWWSGSVA